LSKLLSQWHAPLDFPVQFEISPDWRVFAFAAVVSIVTGLLFGLGPALQLSRTDVNGVLKGGSGIAVFKRRFRFALRDLLVAAEVALCFVLVFASILSLRGLQYALTMQIGFQPEGVAVAAVDLGLAGYSDPQAKAFQRRLMDALRNSPGVVSAAYANSLPLSIDQSSTGAEAADQPPQRGRNATTASYYDISPGLLSTLGAHLLSGRDFDPHDNDHSPRVAIVNQTFAKIVMRTADPIGKSFRRGVGGKGSLVRVIGLVEDGKYESLTEPPRPTIFWSSGQELNSTTTVVVRSRRPPAEVVEQIRKQIAGMDSRLPIYGAGSLVKLLGFALLPMHAAAVALGAFGILAIVLAVTGIHGLVAYAVARRTRELGIRIAIGARSSEVLRLVLGRLSLLVLVGLGLGVMLALAAGTALSAIIFGVSPRDHGLLLTVFLLLILAAGLSCWSPAVRALRTDPVKALRYD
jgi:predicted permease